MSTADPNASTTQPWFPRFRMIWFFVAVVLVAVALFVIRAADQGQALAAAAVLTVVFVTIVCACSAASFLVAFLFGAMEKALEAEERTPTSPFIDGSLPDQIVPPKPTDDG